MTNSGHASMQNNEKFCIIGGGPTGVGTAKALKKCGIDFDIVEAEKDFGGLWGIDYKSRRVYNSAHLISSKNNTQFSDYPMPDSYPAYPSHKLFLQYIQQMAKHFDLYANAIFNTRVTNLEAVDHYWKVTFDSGETRLYRGVLVANGRLREPAIPIYPGKFSGISIHSSEYKNPESLKGKRVLIVGAGNSGCDIVVDAVYYADKVIHSTRRGYYYMPKFIFGKPTQDWLMEIGSQFKSNEELWKYVKDIFKMASYDGEDFGLPKPDHEIYASHPIMNSQILYYIGHGDILIKPDVKLLKEHSVVFEDGTEEEIDMIIYASGYRASFPFIPEKYGIRGQDDVEKLYMFSFHRQIDNLLFVGYVNSPSGLGNLVNAGGKLLTNYLIALLKQAPILEWFNQTKQGPNPDLGQHGFVRSERHKYEVDLWKYIKALNYLATKLQM